MKQDDVLDCSQFVPHTCQAFCCGPVPIKKDVYFAHLEKRHRPVKTEQDLGDMIFPDTGTKYCTYLSDDFQCGIYQHRPQTCIDFGKLDNPIMKCPFMDKHGKKRSPEAQQRVEKEFDAAFAHLMRTLPTPPSQAAS